MEGNVNQQFLDFTQLDAWKLAHELRVKIFALCTFLPKNEFGLISQIKRSSESVGANIAEGYGRYHFQENIQYCRQARGSLEETRDHLIYIKDTGMIKKVSSLEHLIDLCLQCRIKLNGYIVYLKKRKQAE
jgi:four helix bundle protein